jgi:hypothetical protein
MNSRIHNGSFPAGKRAVQQNIKMSIILPLKIGLIFFWFVYQYLKMQQNICAVHHVAVAWYHILICAELEKRGRYGVMCKNCWPAHLACQSDCTACQPESVS